MGGRGGPGRLTIPEDRESVQKGHFDDKGKEVVYDGVKELVGHLPPGQVGH